jgi:DNA-directed RNA polymerase specialized sigma24 family protein
MPPPTSPPPFSREHAARVADPRVSDTLQRWLRGRAPQGEVVDMVQAVLADLLPYPDPPPTVEGLITLGRSMLRNKLVDLYRYRARVRAVEIVPRDDGLDETVGAPAPAHAWDEVDRKKREHLVAGLVTGGKLTAADLDVLERADDEGYGALADELGTNEAALRKRAHRNRKLLHATWVRYAAIGVPGLVVVAIILYGLSEPDHVSAPAPPGSTEQLPTEPPPGEPPPREHTPLDLERAAAYRTLASHACEDAEWKKCVDDLDSARWLDPEGDRDPKVGALRAEAARGLGAK